DAPPPAEPPAPVPSPEPAVQEAEPPAESPPEGEAAGQAASPAPAQAPPDYADFIIDFQSGAAGDAPRDPGREAFVGCDLRQETLEKMRAVFVPSPSFKKPHYREIRVCVLRGEERSGRFTASVNLGLLMLGGVKGGRVRHYPAHGATRSLLELYRGVSAEPRTVMVVQNAF